MTGGMSGLVAATLLGPRQGRFNEDGSINNREGHSATIYILGVLILWVGWYGFNCGSTLCMVGSQCSVVAGKVAVNTTMTAASAGITLIIYQRGINDHYNLFTLGNAILSGLVSVTASCAVIEP